MDPVIIAIAAGAASGIALGYHFGKVVVRHVGGQYARAPLVLGFSIAGGVLVLIPGLMMAYLIGMRLGWSYGASSGTTAGVASFGTLFGISVGIAMVLATCLIAGIFGGALSARLIEEARANRDL